MTRNRGIRAMKYLLLDLLLKWWAQFLLVDPVVPNDSARLVRSSRQVACTVSVVNCTIFAQLGHRVQCTTQIYQASSRGINLPRLCEIETVVSAVREAFGGSGGQEPLAELLAPSPSRNSQIEASLRTSHSGS